MKRVFGIARWGAEPIRLVLVVLSRGRTSPDYAYSVEPVESIGVVKDVAKITYGTVIALVRIFQRSGIHRHWGDFVRAYNLPDVDIEPRYQGGYAGPPEITRMRNLKDLNLELPGIQRFFLLLAQATINEFYKPGRDVLGLAARFLDEEDGDGLTDIDALFRELEQAGYRVDENGRIEPIDEAAQLTESDRDEVTQIGSRRFLNKESERIWREAQAAQYPISALFIDTDNFKAINDNHSHRRGDAVLLAIAQTAAAAVRTRGVIGRWGAGDEIVCTLRNMTKDEAFVLGERIRMAVESQEIAGLRVTVTVGVASTEVGVRSLEELWNAADRALNAAKKQGKNRTLEFADAQDVAPRTPRT